MSVQPLGMKNDYGVILTIGLFANEEAFEMVMPMVCNTDTLSNAVLCQDAVNAFVAGPLPDLLGCLSSDTFLAFVAAEGMTNGKLPWRQTFDITDHPGTMAAGVVPTNCAGLMLFYEDPDDVVAPARIGCGKNFLAGIPKAHVIENQIDNTLGTAMGVFADDMQEGYSSVAEPSNDWYRVLSTPKNRVAGQDIKRTIVAIIRAGVYSQKRRLVPRL